MSLKFDAPLDRLMTNQALSVRFSFLSSVPALVLDILSSSGLAAQKY